MAEHRLDPVSQFCLGCNLGAAQIMETGEKECAAIYRTFKDNGLQYEAMITTEERLVVRGHVCFLALGQRGMFELRDIIEEGVRQLREKRR